MDQEQHCELTGLILISLENEVRSGPQIGGQQNAAFTWFQ